MEQIAGKIVVRMKETKMISEDESEKYIYGVQVVLEKIISYSLIFGLAILLHHFSEVFLFFCSLSALRKYAGGIHCRKYSSCLIASMLVTLSSIAIFPIVERSYPIYQSVIIVSMIFMVLIGSVNNPYIDWNDSEFIVAKRIARLTIVVEALVLLLLIEIQVPVRIRFYLSYGIVVCAISMLLEIHRKGGGTNEENGEAITHGNEDSSQETNR